MAKKSKLPQTNAIGLDKEATVAIAKELNNLLANYQIFYINVRGFHWNIAGNQFFELHQKFEELYNDAFLKIDEIAERILTLGHTPFHSYTEYLKNAAIKEATNVSDGNKAVKIVVDSLSTLLEIERHILKLSDEADDEGTNSIMSDYIKFQEKLSWMYNAYLK